MIAGISWLIIWWHQSLTHGDTALNEENLVLGLTWMDSGKLRVIPFGLFFVAIAGLYRSMSQPGLWAKIGFAVSAGSLLAVIAGTALQFWGFEWGSYEEEFEDQAIGVGGALLHHERVPRLGEGERLDVVPAARAHVLEVEDREPSLRAVVAGVVFRRQECDGRLRVGTPPASDPHGA